MKRRHLAWLAPALLLAACSQGQEDDRRSSTGEVLEGTISDAMLPVDQLRSQPPLLENTPSPGAAAGGEPEGDEAEAGEGEAGDAAPPASEADEATAPAEGETP